jgi:hypothetical protein
VIISVKIIKKPRSVRKCCVCLEALMTPVVSMYGAAFRGDRPYRVWVHPKCVGSGGTKDDQKKIDMALASIK